MTADKPEVVINGEASAGAWEKLTASKHSTPNGGDLVGAARGSSSKEG